MKTFKVTHIVLCEVATYRTVTAENYTEALAKVAAIETYTATGVMECDYEIISDRNVLLMEMKEVEK